MDFQNDFYRQILGTYTISRRFVTAGILRRDVTNLFRQDFIHGVRLRYYNVTTDLFSLTNRLLTYLGIGVGGYCPMSNLYGLLNGGTTRTTSNANGRCDATRYGFLRSVVRLSVGRAIVERAN